MAVDGWVGIQTQEAVADLVREFCASGEPITDNSNILHTLCTKLEYLLQYDQKEKTKLLGARKDYWDYFSDCLTKHKGQDDGIRFVKSITELNTSLGKGRAFIRYCLVHQRLADSLQQCMMNVQVTSDWYYVRNPFLVRELSLCIITCLYDLNEVYFDLAPRGHDLDAHWPTFARRSLGSPISNLWKPPSQSSSLASLTSNYSQMHDIPDCLDKSNLIPEERLETLQLAMDHSELRQRSLEDMIKQLQAKNVEFEQQTLQSTGELPLDRVGLNEEQDLLRREREELARFKTEIEQENMNLRLMVEALENPSRAGKLQELEMLYEQHEDGLKQKLALLESANAELQQKMLHEIQITKVDGAKLPLETKPELDHLHSLEDTLQTLAHTFSIEAIIGVSDNERCKSYEVLFRRKVQDLLSCLLTIRQGGKQIDEELKWSDVSQQHADGNMALALKPETSTVKADAMMCLQEEASIISLHCLQELEVNKRSKMPSDKLKLEKESPEAKNSVLDTDNSTSLNTLWQQDVLPLILRESEEQHTTHIDQPEDQLFKRRESDVADKETLKRLQEEVLNIKSDAIAERELLERQIKELIQQHMEEIKQCNEKKAKVKETKSSAEQQQKQVEDAQTQTFLAGKHPKLQEQNDDLVEKLSTALKEITVLLERVKKLEEDNYSLVSSRETAEESLRDLQRCYKEKESDSCNLEDQLYALKEEKETLRRKLEENALSLQEEQKRKESLEEAKNVIENEKNALSSKLDLDQKCFEGKLKQVEQVLADLKKDAKVDLDSLTNERDMLKNHLDVKQDEIACLLKNKSILQSQGATEESAVDHLKTTDQPDEKNAPDYSNCHENLIKASNKQTQNMSKWGNKEPMEEFSVQQQALITGNCELANKMNECLEVFEDISTYSTTQEEHRVKKKASQQNFHEEVSFGPSESVLSTEGAARLTVEKLVSSQQDFETSEGNSSQVIGEQKIEFPDQLQSTAKHSNQEQEEHLVFFSEKERSLQAQVARQLSIEEPEHIDWQKRWTHCNQLCTQLQTRDRFLTAENAELQDMVFSLKERFVELLRDKDTLWQKAERLSGEVEQTSGHHWQLDRDAVICVECQSNFSIRNRKHHCRSCGRIFCDSCSNNWVLNESGKKERHCTTCYAARLEMAQCSRGGQAVPTKTLREDGTILN
uniref:FYVE and coiled-coil domain-containing protein 1-like isoform X2 n=1 Tax=Myxine glutinosa TaxID=7769 RepID=UPI00358E90A2